jgi:hypothetical protein
MEVSNIIALGSLILSLVAFIKSCFAERRDNSGVNVPSVAFSNVPCVAQ